MQKISPFVSLNMIDISIHITKKTHFQRRDNHCQQIFKGRHHKMINHQHRELEELKHIKKRRIEEASSLKHTGRKKKDNQLKYLFTFGKYSSKNKNKNKYSFILSFLQNKILSIIPISYSLSFLIVNICTKFSFEVVYCIL